MKVAILGSGNVATHLSKVLIKAGHPVKQIWSRNHENAIDLALEIGANSIPDIGEIGKEIELIIVAIKDDAIAEVINKIPQNSQALIFHTSGTADLDLLSKRFENCGVLYPLQTFSKNSDIDFSIIPIFVEGSNSYSIEKVTNLANQISEKVIYADSKTRALLHISAVFACNFTNAFYTIAQEITDSVNLDFDLLRPLIQETADKAMLNQPKDVQTGPAKRNDLQIMQKHLKLLENEPQLKDLYQSISQYIVKMYSK
ncbi:MAG: DUF2520 domain-containing protein [Bacteroidetes bacterium]|nr:DUF2520 domain-containing protein [Bacteroidota bacterium]MBU1486279.1 DUF2520 domain-containing protein [Bacteroidota bacterium]MBU1759268.1 DUF2520 domain-containing protein [Bacteroidota bacterium]MBU2267200.1 DUF2520 domain-containing protein [Bacteroidota bacterium]MBU2376085.1 DUF2520 domain-containing protein [Bacteroidota bacterium]